MDEAVDRAQRVFWAKGYEATSISDLTKGMGINKGSLYNAFGSKKRLFTRALLKYDRDNRQAGLAALGAVNDPRDAVEALFEGLIADSVADQERKGCFLVNTALDLPNLEDDVKDLVADALGDFEAFFGRIIVNGQTNGAISPTVEAAATAKSLVALVVGLRVLARGIFEEKDLAAIKQDALRLIDGRA
jgi:TetR/AcrR family transcriptional repressor of nem operon